MSTVETKNEIRTELVLRAPRSKVWHALTTKEGWTGWFSNAVQGDFRTGETLTLDFGEYGLSYAIVAEVNPEISFAYKWHPGEDCGTDKYPESEMTTVRFTLADHQDGTLLTLVESGFENLPEERRSSAVRLNTDGWKYELIELQAWVERGEKQSLSQENIVCERLYQASPEALWDAIATPDGLKKWFVKDVIGEFKEGNLVTLVFTDAVSGPLKILTMQKPSGFSFRWHPGQDNGCKWEDFPEDETTIVTYTITPEENGTSLKMVESGFYRVPESRRAASKTLNSQGWTEVMEMIAKAVQ